MFKPFEKFEYNKKADQLIGFFMYEMNCGAGNIERMLHFQAYIEPPLVLVKYSITLNERV